MGDKVTFSMDFSPYFGDMALIKLFALMIMDNEGMYIDFDNLELRYNDGNSTLPLSAFGLTEVDKTLELDFIVKQVYDEPNGRFNLVFGNAALIDCSRVFAEFRAALIVKIDEISPLNPYHEEAMALLEAVTAWVLEKGITFCDFSYDLEGVLKD